MKAMILGILKLNYVLAFAIIVFQSLIKNPNRCKVE